MDNKLESLFELIETSDTKAYSSILFNIYEDRDHYTIEACFDDDFVIGRDNPFVICDKTNSWEKVEQDIGLAIKTQVEEKKDPYKHFTSIAYGFVRSGGATHPARGFLYWNDDVNKATIVSNGFTIE